MHSLADDCSCLPDIQRNYTSAHAKYRSHAQKVHKGNQELYLQTRSEKLSTAQEAFIGYSKLNNCLSIGLPCQKIMVGSRLDKENESMNIITRGARRHTYTIGINGKTKN